MKGGELQGLATGERVTIFLDANAEKLGTAVNAVHRKTFDDAVAALAGCRRDQDESTSAVIGATALLKVMRDAIYREYLVTIADIARSKKLNDPTLVVHARIDRQGDFLLAARQLLESAPKYTAVWDANDVAPEFFDDLRAAVGALKALEDSREMHRVRVAEATGAAPAANRAVRGLIKEIGNTLKRVFRNDAGFLAGWATASKFHRRPVEPRRGGSVVLPPDANTEE